MAADGWQLVNGWELVDWSLAVDGDTPDTPTAVGSPIFRRHRIIIDRLGDDADAIALVLALL